MKNMILLSITALAIGILLIVLASENCPAWAYIAAGLSAAWLVLFSIVNADYFVRGGNR